VVTQFALREHHRQMPCRSSDVHTLWQLLQYPVIACPLSVYLPNGEQALRLGLSDIQLLTCECLLFIITQKDILFINRMNLYFRGHWNYAALPGMYVSMRRLGGESLQRRSEVVSTMPSGDSESEFLYLAMERLFLFECHTTRGKVCRPTTEAKTRFCLFETPSMATCRIRLSENLFAEGRNPQRRLSEGDCLRLDLMYSSSTPSRSPAHPGSSRFAL